MINSIQSSPSKTNNNMYAKIRSGIGAVAGTAIPLAIMMKNRKIKNPFKMEYGLQDMLILSGTSVAGGTVAGMIGENKKTNKNKFKEGVFQFLNASIPTWIVGGVLKLPESSNRFNNPATKVASVLGGLVVGMFGAAQVSNLVFDPKDKEPDRKLTFKDCLVNADDALGALTMARLPIIQNLHLDTVLPAIYAYCGYRAGKTS